MTSSMKKKQDTEVGVSVRLKFDYFSQKSCYENKLCLPRLGTNGRSVFGAPSVRRQLADSNRLTPEL